MGNSSGYSDDAKEVVLCLHAVHNVQHSPTESYYGLATNHSSDSEVAVTSERPAKLFARIDSVLSVRVYLHERGASSLGDRPVGQLSIPVQEMLDVCGPGIFMTWLSLSDCTAYGAASHGQIAEAFRVAIQGVPQNPSGPRVCLTLLEASARPNDWVREDSDRATYYDPVLLSQMQHLHLSQSYFNQLESTLGSDEYARREVPDGARAEECAQLHRDLDEVTEEANRRIERGNSTILTLKAQIRELSENESPQLRRDCADAERRLESAKQTNARLKQRTEQGQGGPALDEELQKLRQEVQVLTNQKAALMKTVQDIYGSGQNAALGAEVNDVSAATAAAQVVDGASAQHVTPLNRILPDFHEVRQQVHT